MRIRIVCSAWFILFLHGLLFAQNGAGYRWDNVKIGGGGFVSAIITTPAQKDLIYARTDVGGVYRWHEGTQRWIPLLDWASKDLWTYYGVESLAIDPQSPNKVYLSVGLYSNSPSAILRSDDYGQTFSSTVVNFQVNGNGMGRQNGERLAVDPNAGHILFCGSRQNGLWKSTDGAVTWSQVSTFPVTKTPNINTVCFVLFDKNSSTAGTATKTIYAGVSRSGTNIYVSKDGGATWNAVSGAPSAQGIMPQRAVLAPDGRYLYITYSNGAGPHNQNWDGVDEKYNRGAVFRYDTQTGVWTDISPEDFLSDTNLNNFRGTYGGISMDHNNPQRLIVSTPNYYGARHVWPDGKSGWGGSIYLSEDGGEHWTALVTGFSSLIDFDTDGFEWMSGGAMHWMGSIEFDPYNSKRVFVTSGNGIFMTDNLTVPAARSAWKFASDGIEETVPLNMVSVPGGPLVSVIGDYDGFVHHDVAVAPATRHMPAIGTSTGITYAGQQPQVMVRAGTASGTPTMPLYHSADGGQSWTPFVSGRNNLQRGQVALSADGAVVLWAPADGSAIYRTNNWGASWSTVVGLYVTGLKPQGDPVNADVFYVYNPSNGGLYVSTDKGVNLSNIKTLGTGGTSTSLALAPDRQGDIWVALGNNGLKRYLRAGDNLSVLSSVSQCTSVSLGKSAPGNTYPAVYIWGVVGGVQGVFRSDDEGANWLRIDDDAHLYGGLGNGNIMVADNNVYGRVYLTTAGRGIVYGEPAPTCTPDDVVPHITVNGQSKGAIADVSVMEGNTVILSPDAPVGGTWQWVGANNFSSTNREITLSNITAQSTGYYFVRYTNATGCASGIERFKVNVTRPVVLTTGIAVTAEGGNPTIAQKGGSLQLLATVTPANATNKTVTWSLDNTGLATLSLTGMLTAKNSGTVRVRATANDGSAVFGELEVTIKSQVVTSVAESPDPAFKIYPNPATTVVVIEGVQVINTVEIITTDGRSTGLVGHGSGKTVINVNTLPPGIYILKISVGQKDYFRRMAK
jgi:xyloglucan-specific exo-beta-1,4-glucanase